jgi:mannose-6-phosphate isomerase-like protein (cupin superfamily)
MTDRAPPLREKVNLAEKFGRFDELWTPKTVGEVNDFLVKLVKMRGTFVWHRHETEDELFLLVRGRMIVRLRDRDIALEPGEFFVVPRNVEHLPVVEHEAEALLLEPRSTVNTGDAGGPRTTDLEWI